MKHMLGWPLKMCVGLCECVRWYTMCVPLGKGGNMMHYVCFFRGGGTLCFCRGWRNTVEGGGTL